MSVEIPEFPPLFKRTATGDTQVWKIRVERTDLGSAFIIITHGLLTGKQQETTEQITQGKNVGKKNETSPIQQAVNEAQARWTKQRDRKCYGLTVEESAGKRDEAPMLAKVYQDHAQKVDWSTAYEQPKLDGYRCLTEVVDGEILFWSREGKPFVLPHVADALKSVVKEGDKFDGEIYLQGMPLNQIGSLIKRPRAETEQLRYHIYDAPLPVTFQERLMFLYQRFPRFREFGPVIPVQTVKVNDEETLLKLQAEWIDQGFEGAMLRYGDLPYQAGKRADCLLKVKTFIDGEFMIVGAKEGRGPYAGMAIFQCVTPAGHKFDVTAPGTLEEKRAAWQNIHMWIDKPLTVKYAYMTATETPVPWHPVAKGLAKPLVD